jgi:hypothetical protein
MGFWKNTGKAAIRISLGNEFIRYLLTSGYNSGFVALGECNHYLFPSKYVTIDMGDADFSMIFKKPIRLPFATNSQSVVYAAHVLEHVGEDISDLIREVHRILKPGGGFRIEVPDSQYLLNSYVSNTRTVLDHFRNHRERLCAEYGFDTMYLEDQITLVGEIASYNQSDRDLVHLPVYLSADDVSKAIEAGGLKKLEVLALSQMTQEQRDSGGHNGALHWEQMQNELKEAGFSSVHRMVRGQTLIPHLYLGAGIRSIWNVVREKKRREFYSLYIDAIK